MSQGQRPDASGAHAARPLDLVALVAFGGEVVTNQAVTRERLGRPEAAPRPLGAALAQWLGLGRRTWLDLRGREIEGIATARELTPAVWAIETLIDASAGAPDGGGEARDSSVLRVLLQQAVEAARAARATHLLLRTPAETAAQSDAMRLGFTPVVSERLWSAERLARAEPAAGADVMVREVTAADEFARFQLFNRALPLDGRQAIALTVEEWRDTRERRWLGRGAVEFVATVDDRVTGELRLSTQGETSQLDLTLDAEHPESGAELLEVAAQRLGDRPLLALIAESQTATGALLAAHGLEPRERFMLLCWRGARPITVRQRARAGMAVPTRG